MTPALNERSISQETDFSSVDQVGDVNLLVDRHSRVAGLDDLVQNRVVELGRVREHEHLETKTIARVSILRQEKIL